MKNKKAKNSGEVTLQLILMCFATFAALCIGVSVLLDWISGAAMGLMDKVLL